MWAASRNQNLLHLETSPVARVLEARIISWLSSVFGMTGGHLLPGSTLANITALLVARELRGVRQVVTSTASHLSIIKAVSLLGLELVTVPTDQLGRVHLEALNKVDDMLARR
jgi:L-2,4-diaminobutyrate decarboxylase